MSTSLFSIATCAGRVMWTMFGKCVSVSVAFTCLFLVPAALGSAIPMWEYLSRGEKMSHLFNMFVQQVEKHCSTTPEPDCSKLLLVYGLTNLAKMEDDSLDGMDPYQRGANEIVWDHMMKGSHKHSHVSGYTTTAATPTESTSSASVTTPPLSDNEDLDVGSFGAASSINEETQPQSFLLGPMVVRVLPNGMPIPGEKNHLPKDEDVEEFAPTKFRNPYATQPVHPGHPVASERMAQVGADYVDSRYYNPSAVPPPRQQFYQDNYGPVRVRSPIYSTIR